MAFQCLVADEHRDILSLHFLHNAKFENDLLGDNQHSNFEADAHRSNHSYRRKDADLSVTLSLLGWALPM